MLKTLRSVQVVGQMRWKRDWMLKVSLYSRVLLEVIPPLAAVEVSTTWQGGGGGGRFDRSKLPSAPRKAQARNIDMSRLPKAPPYTVYLGNLSYECNEEDIVYFFQRKQLKVSLSHSSLCACSEGEWVCAAGEGGTTAYRQWNEQVEGVWIRGVGDCE